MSSLTIMELDLMFGLLAELLGQPPASQVSAEEERRRREAEMEQIQNGLRDAEERAEKEYADRLRALEEQQKTYAASAMAEQLKAVAEQNVRLADLREIAREILREASAAGSEYLSDYANLVYSREEYTQLLSDRQRIVDAAQDLLSEADIRSADDTEGRIRVLSARVAELKSAWERLQQSLRRAAGDAAQTAALSEQFAAWLTKLDAGTQDMRDGLCIFPDSDPEDEEAVRVREAERAAANIGYYLFSPDSFYLGSEQKNILRRLYALGAEDVPDLEAEETGKRNLRFAASMQRDLDETIYTMRRKVRKAYETYIRMCSRLNIPEDKRLAPSQYADADALLSAISQETRRMERRTANRIRREIVQSVIDRAIRSARRGMTVRQLGEEETDAGNWRAMYQIGQAGTTIEVYTDARGQVTIETGALLEGGADAPTKAQSAAIVRNNERFCTSELPDIVARLTEELEAAGEEAEIQVREKRGPEDVHIFTPGRSLDDARRGLVLRADGTAAAQGAAAAAAEKPRYMEEEQ